MAKAAKTAIKKDAAAAAESKNYSKVIRAVKTKTDAYSFKGNMVHKDKVADFLKK